MKATTAKTKKIATDLMSDTLRGTISKLHCAYERFSAGKLDAQDRVSPVSFSAPLMLVEGARVIMKGRWEKDPKYGTQFKATSVEYDERLDANGLALWLQKNALAKGIGKAKARKIADTYAERFDEIITNDPKQIQTLVNLTNEQLALLCSTWNDEREFHKLNTWLASLGCSIKQIEQIKEKYGNAAFGLLKSAPYQIIGELAGTQFLKADKIAQASGIKKDHPGRIRAAIIYCVRDRLRNGDTYVEKNELVVTVNRLLGLDMLNSKAIIADAIDELVKNGALIQHKLKTDEDNERDEYAILDPAINEKECFLAKIFLTDRGDFSPLCHPIDWDKLKNDDDLRKLNDAQRQAHDIAMQNCIALIMGSAGSGKTYLIAEIIRHFGKNDLRVAVCAPTGKAARRLEEVTHHKATTIHILLEYNPRYGFQCNAANPLEHDVVIVDETSMIDDELAYHLVKAIDFKRTALVLVGDPNQLPPVGPGNLLRDLAQNRVIPVVELTTIIRQAGILKVNSSAILEGRLEKTCKPNEKNGFVPWQVIGNLTDAMQCRLEILGGYEKILTGWPTANIIHSIQILSPQRKGVLGCDALNVELQKITQRVKWGVTVEDTVEDKKPKFYAKDKVIQVHNDYKLDVMNGTIGEVIEIQENGGILVAFEGNDNDEATLIPPDKRANLHLAYCLTVHKTQGSQYPYVMLCIHKQHSFMHHRGILYTGATRAQKKLIVLGDAWGLRNCVSKVEVDKRKTYLGRLLEKGQPNSPS